AGDPAAAGRGLPARAYSLRTSSSIPRTGDGEGRVHGVLPDPREQGAMTMAGRRQAFSTAEFQARLARVREQMQSRSIDVLLVNAPENIYYLTGYQTSGYFAYQALIVPAAAAPLLLIRHLEQGNVAEYSWLSDAATW